MILKTRYYPWQQWPVENINEDSKTMFLRIVLLSLLLILIRQMKGLITNNGSRRP